MLDDNTEKINVVINSAITPFSYLKDGKYVGYALDLAVRFCEEYGYSMNIEDVEISAMMAGIGSGRYDMCAATLSVTPEREESILFSDTFYNGGVVLAVRSSDIEAAAAENFALAGAITFIVGKVDKLTDPRKNQR